VPFFYWHSGAFCCPNEGSEYPEVQLMPSVVNGVTMDETLNVKSGWQLWAFTVPAKAAAGFQKLAEGSRAWYGVMFVPGDRQTIELRTTDFIKKWGFRAELPDSNLVNKTLPPSATNTRVPKWFSKPKLTFFMWVNITHEDPSIVLGKGAAHNQICKILVDAADPSLWTSSALPNEITWKIYRTAIVQPVRKPSGKPPIATKPLTPSPTSPAIIGGTVVGAVKPVIITNPLNPLAGPINALSAQVGQLQQNLTAQGGGNVAGAIDEPRKSQLAVDGWTNPWLWGLGAFALFAGAIVIRQFRGAARDLGSGVKSTYGEAKGGVNSAAGDPT
jgi:hypothetical protein